MEVIPSNDDRIVVADEMNADFGRIYSWGWKWNINFLSLLSVMHFVCHLKKDVDLHPPLFMAVFSILEVDILKILGNLYH